MRKLSSVSPLGFSLSKFCTYIFCGRRFNTTSDENSETCPSSECQWSLARLLRDRYLLETEMALGDCVLAMTSPADAPDALPGLLQALLELEGSPQVFSGPGRDAGEDAPPLPEPETVLPVGLAVRMDMEAVPADEAAGRICGEYLDQAVSVGSRRR